MEKGIIVLLLLVLIVGMGIYEKLRSSLIRDPSFKEFVQEAYVWINLGKTGDRPS